MNNKIEKIEFIKKGYKNKLHIIIKYDDGSQYIKKLTDKDKKDLFYTLINIRILNKYRK